jgi:two-component system, NtrC family, response regulator AtoC
MRLWQDDSMPDDGRTAPSQRRGQVPRRRTLVVMRGAEVDARPLPLAGEVTVGRGDDVDVRIDDPSVSRVHLAIRLEPHAIAVIDRGSANGTTLREVRMPTGVPVQVSANEPFAAGDVVLVVQEIGAALPVGEAGAGAPRPRMAAPARDAAPEPIVLDPTMRQLYDLAARVARGTISVLLTGQTGTGKDVLAEHLHRSSTRAGAPLVRINCAAFSDTLVEAELFGHAKGAFTGANADRQGLLEAADGGTVFLDEIGELPLALQAKLLRVVEDRAVMRVGSTTARAVDVRFVAATNRDLEAEVDAGRFRRDLYFRLAGVVLALPPLAERPEEIDALARRFAAEAAAKLGRAAPRLDASAIAALRAHAWTGNVRELRNAIERAVLVADAEVLAAGALMLGDAKKPAPEAPAAKPTATKPAPASLPDELAELEKQRILAALEECGGNQTRAAEKLGMPLRTFVKRLTAYQLPRPRKPR